MTVKPRAMEMTSELLTGPGTASAPPDPPRRAGSRVPSSVPELPEPMEDTMKKTVSVRLSVDVINRLREYTHHSRHQKQDVIEVAIARFLMDEGY